MTHSAPSIQATLDPDRMEGFADRFVGALNEAGLLVLCSLGHRTGLFDVLVDGEPRTSAQLAENSGLHERYVREWLRGLTVAGVVELVGDDRFRLPLEHGALLARTGEEPLAHLAQFVTMAGTVEDDLVRCFHEGGGVPYERYHRFHEIMAEDSGQTVVGALHEHILPLAPGLTDRLDAGISVADLGCGRGEAVLELARCFPESDFLGVDLSDDAIGFARDRSSEEGLHNVRFEARDLSDFESTAPEDAFDLVTTFDAVHDQPNPAGLVKGIRRALRPDGIWLMQDIHAHSHVRENLEHPLGTILYTLSLAHCMPVSLAQENGAGLGTMWGREKARELMSAAGFEDIEVHRLDHDIQNDYWVVR